VRYRVVFSKRFTSEGRESPIDPTAELDGDLPDGVVAEKVFVERLEPLAQHSQEVLDEDDAFLGASAPEVWEYEVVDERVGEFMLAVRNSEVVMELDLLDESETTPDEATEVALGNGDSKNPDAPTTESAELSRAESGRPRRPRPRAPSRAELGEPSRAGSGVRAADEGPIGEPTVDPSAGGMDPGKPYFGNDQSEGIATPGAEGLDELRIANGRDPSLGLTRPGHPGSDWAANTGPSRLPERGIQTRDIADRSSTLRPAPSRGPATVAEPEPAPESKEPQSKPTRAKKPKARKHH
jgi:hypothetical protein